MSTFLLTRGRYSSDWISRFDSSTLCYEFSKITHCIGKKYCNHRAPMQWNGSFWPKISPIFAFRLQRSIQYSRIKACFLILLKESNYRPYRVSEWVLLLIICWNFEYVNSFALRDAHRLKKQKYEISRTFAVKREKTPPVECSPAHRSGWYMEKPDKL
jgi:hypothetical protein